MTAINSYYSQMTASKKGIGGLATGLDTDSIVEALLTGTRNKLAVQGQKKTKLNWQMTAYRSIATTLRNFQTKHLSTTGGSSSLVKYEFFNVYKGSATSDAITVKPGSGSSTGTFTVEEISQLATNHTFSTAQYKSELVGNEIDFTNNDFIGKTLVLSYGNDTKTIRLDSLQNKTTQTDFQTELQSLIDNAFGTVNNPDYIAVGDPGHDPAIPQELKLNVSVNQAKDEGGVVIPGKFAIQLDGGTNVVTVKNTADGLGLTNGMSSRFEPEKNTIKDLFGDQLVGESLVIRINDVELSFSANSTLSNVMSKINSSSAGVTVRFNTVNEKFVFSSKVSGAGNNLDMRDIEGNFLHLWAGAQSGTRLTSVATVTNASQTGGQLDLTGIQDADLSNYKMRIQYGGTSIIINPDLTDYQEKINNNEMTKEQAIIASLNDSLKSAFGENSGLSFEIAADNTVSFVSTRNDQTIRVMDHENEDSESLLDLLGMSDQITENYTMGYKGSVTGGDLGDMGTLLNTMKNNSPYAMDVTVNGVTKTLSVSVTTAELLNLSTDEEREQFLARKLNAALDEAFADVADVKKLGFSIENGKILFKTTDTSISFSLEATDIDASNPNPPSDLFAALALDQVPLTADDQLANFASGQGTKISDICSIPSTGGEISIKLGDDEKVFTYDASTTLQDLIRNVNEYFGKDILTFKNGHMVIDGSSQAIEIKDPTGNNLTNALFGVSSYATTAATNTAALDAGQGQNALIKIDGQWIPSTSNTFTYNGVDFEVNQKSSTPVDITVSTDPDDVVEKLKNFMEEYNTMVQAIQTLLKESPVAGYEPLTDEQRAEMTEDQIKQWEEEAKKGLLRSDPTVSRIMTQMRTALYTSVSAAGLALYDIGITTETFAAASSYTFSGKLEMTEEGEKRLRSALEQNPDAVRTLFTDSQEGLATQLNKIINGAVLISSTNPGSLVSLAGSDVLTGDNTSSISRKIETIDKQIANLKLRLENEYDRYWRQFTALETAISRMDTQSSYISSMFGTSSN